MALDAERGPVPALSRCAACGSPYRTPRWEREYRCPTCGATLEASRRVRARPRVPAWLPALLVAAFLSASVARVALVRLYAADDRPTRSRRGTVARLQIPTRYAESLRLKEGLLEADLALAPEHPVLLAELAATRIRLAVHAREAGDTGERDAWLDAAKPVVERLQSVRPEAAAELERQLVELDAYTWVIDQRAGTLHHFQLTSELGIELLAGEWALVAAVPYVTASVPASGVPNVLGAPGSMSRTRRRSDPPPPEPEPPPLNGPDPNRIPELRRRFAADPADPDRAHALGAALELLAELEKGREEETGTGTWEPVSEQEVAGMRLPDGRLPLGAGGRRRYVVDPRGWRAVQEEAARVYESVAERAVLRLDRGMGYLAAARARGKLQDWEGQYRLLCQAAEATPYSLRVWEDLHAAALRTQRSEEARRARREMQEWSFPGLGRR